MKVNGKVVVVTGAGSGIGRELVLRLLAKGARVAAVDISPDSLEQTAAIASDYQDRLALFVANVADRPRVESLPEQVMAQFGVVDAVINNAGIIQPFCRLNDLDYPTLERVLNVNLFGTLYFIKAFLPRLLERPEAHIVNVSSMGGFVPVPGQTIYGAAKAAVKLLSEGLASELLHTRVRVTVVFPGAVATNIMKNSGLMPPGAGNATDGRDTTNPKDRKGSKALQPLPADRAAITIVEGMERNRLRVFVGRDAALMDKLYRLSPGFAGRTIARAMGGLLPAPGRKGR
jgi:NAD(P)-dependent dehydrogenase (short-subunit alcohol dehydrogenase family)